MARTVAIGLQDFETVITNGYLYIDKTSFIREWWEKGDSVTLIARPRRFGKTLNMSMLEKFFSVRYEKRGDLFEGLSIWEDEKYRKLQGTYPVISLSFADVKAENYQVFRERICQLITMLYIQNSFLKKCDWMHEREREFFDSVCDGMSDVVATRAIQSLCGFLYRCYGKRPIILLDEYDTPMQEAYVGGYWEEIVGFMRSFFNSTFKTNTNLERAVMTGVTRVSKESILSDLNHLEVGTTTSGRYTTSFGFTEEEVFAALDEQGLSGEKEKVKYWYGGFIFGECQDIYNPCSILNFLEKKKFDTYCANTSSKDLVGKLLREGGHWIKEQFEILLQGGSMRTSIDEQVVYSMLDRDESSIWSLLLGIGYLKVLHCEWREKRGPLYELALTNHEVQCMFRSMVPGWFSEAEEDYNKFVKALLQGDLEAMNAHMSGVAFRTFSYFDTGKGVLGAEPERFYHGLVLGLMVELQNRYVITSNRESGFGRYDVVIEPKDPGSDAIIIEFKVRSAGKEATLQDTVAAALRQIEEKQYAAGLVSRGILEGQIRSYGFAFEGKQVLIGEGGAVL